MQRCEKDGWRDAERAATKIIKNKKDGSLSLDLRLLGLKKSFFSPVLGTAERICWSLHLRAVGGR